MAFPFTFLNSYLATYRGSCPLHFKCISAAETKFTLQHRMALSKYFKESGNMTGFVCFLTQS